MGESGKPAKCDDCPQFQIDKGADRYSWEGKCLSLKIGRNAFSDSCDQPKNWGKNGVPNSAL